MKYGMKNFEMRRALFFLIPWIVLVISTCYNPPTSEKRSGDTGTVTPPYNIVAEEGEYFIKVSWLDRDNADYYRVYRNVNDTGWVEDTGLLHNKEYNDYEPGSNDQVAYKIRSTVKGRSSELSEVSNVIMGDTYTPAPDPPTNLLAYTDGGRVRISWAYSENADYYLVFRKYDSYQWQPLTNHSIVQVNWIYDENPVDFPVVYYGVKAMRNDVYSDIAVTVLDCSTCPTPTPTPAPTAEPTPVGLEGEVLEIVPFIEENMIQVSWPVIPDTYEYALLRDTDAAGDFTDMVYRGTDTTYLDTSFVNNQFYYYKLALLDNTGAAISTSDFSFGMGSHLKADKFEPNETIDNAVVLNPGINTANIYCYKDAYNNTLLDTDWYYIILDPLESKEIVIDNFTNITDNEHLYITLDTDEEPIVLGEGDSFILSNQDIDVANSYFKISVDTQSYINEMGTYQIIVE